jgi:signal transduction histidine kinase
VEGTQAPAGPWPLLATLGLGVQIMLECRCAPPRQAALAAPPAVVAESLLTVPITSPTSHGWLENVAVCAFWSLIGLTAVAGGLYLRRLDTARLRAVREARRAQRVQLATDLHDFVAHDVSAMVVQLQAAQITLAGDPEGTAGLLRRIEADGVRALTAMDRTVQLLRELEDGAGASRTPLPDATNLPELTDRYAAGSDATVTLMMEPGLDTALIPEAGATVYRVVTEALTNVRRHAKPGAAVTVHLRRQASGVALTVTDRPGDAADSRPTNPFTDRPAGRRHGGTGLAALTERVEMLGGRLTFGREPPAGWRVHAELPHSALQISRPGSSALETRE